MALKDDFEKLLPGMGDKDLNRQREAQQAWQQTCFELGAPGQEAQRTEACSLMATHVGTDTPKPTRVWLLKQLERIGGAESVDALSTAADDKDAHVRSGALCALANNAAAGAGAKLAAKLSGANGAAKVAVINALGYRTDSGSAGALTKELTNSDDAVAIAAAKALGKSASADAAKSLAAARGKSAGEVRRWINDAYLLCADRLLADGQEKEAAAIYAQLTGEKESEATRAAAQRGLSLAKS